MRDISVTVTGRKDNARGLSLAQAFTPGMLSAPSCSFSGLQPAPKGAKVCWCPRAPGVNAWARENDRAPSPRHLVTLSSRHLVTPSPRHPLTSSSPRRGVSLIEILICLFIILVGLLGVAALLPVGRYDIMVAAKADRGAACARAVMRDFVVRGILSQTVDATTGNSVPPLVALAIDPRGCAANALPPPLFPASSIFGATLPPAVSMSRVTVASAWSNPMTLARADRVCRWRDDLQFDMSGERTERPRQQFQYQLAAPNNIGLGQLDADPAKRGTELTADPEGAYSWLATVCPTSDPTQFTVSIVVFYNRSVTVDQELACGINLFGGGDGTLYVPTSGTPPGYDPAAVRERIMALRPGDWILLRGVNATATVYGFKWYRVAALGDFVAVPTATANGSRLVTLAGPDWDPSFVPPPTGTGMTEVGLFDNHQVVGVYTETVQVGR